MQSGFKITHECGEAALEVEINNIMVPVPPKPGHVIVIFGQPLEDCSTKAFKAGRHHRSRSVMFEDIRIKADMQSSQRKETVIRRYFSCQLHIISPLPMSDEDWAVIESLKLLLRRHLVR